jgi:F-type H+-transporting ATPase subunit gamma
MERITNEIPQETGDESSGTHLIVPITSDRGLCGGVNNTVGKAAKALNKELKGDKFIAILGMKGQQLLARTHGQQVQYSKIVSNNIGMRDVALILLANFKIVRCITEIYKSPTSFALASEIAEEISSAKQYDKAHIIYNRFKSAIAYETLVDEVDSAGSTHN